MPYSAGSSGALTLFGPGDSFRRFPQVHFVRRLEMLARRRLDHLDARLERIRRVHRHHHRHRAVVEAHEIAGRVDAEQLREAAHQMLIELLAVAALHHFENAIRRERLLIGALRSHRVVDVGDAAQHGADVEPGARDAERIAGAVEAQVMFEGDHRRDGRHLRRAAQDFRAVDDVHAHHRELGVGQLVRLVEDLGRRAHLADVVHQRREAELAQRRALRCRARAPATSSGSRRSPCA